MAEERLRKGFAWFVVAMGLFILSQEVPKLMEKSAMRGAGPLLDAALVALAVPIGWVMTRRKNVPAGVDTLGQPR